MLRLLCRATYALYARSAVLILALNPFRHRIDSILTAFSLAILALWMALIVFKL